ncbi:MAG: potassium/proton antiporter [Proteobacteria bacterium]|nr:potassium/proton antiporter [Pseudomonadota bacterium]
MQETIYTTRSIMAGIDLYIFGFALILTLSIVLKKVLNKLGFPSLAIFLGLGMFAGSEGIGGIYFDDFQLAYSIGTVSLIFILYSSGLHTDWVKTRPILWEGLALSTLGVIVATTLVGLIIHFTLDLSILEGLLLGAILASTDVSAISLVLKSQNISISPKTAALLKFESGSNDPVAVFITLTLIHLLVNPTVNLGNSLLFLIKEVCFGVLAGVILGKLIPLIISKLNLKGEGLAETFSIGGALLAYACAVGCQGSGFLASYIAGLVVAKHDFSARRSIQSFHESITWLIEITMFFTLGLLVFPSKLIPIISSGLWIAILSILLARPTSVFMCMAFSKTKTNEKLFISWLGLKGGVTIILAIFPLVYNVPKADLLFNVIFFAVIISVLLQQPLVNIVGRALSLASMSYPKKHSAPD